MVPPPPGTNWLVTVLASLPSSMVSLRSLALVIESSAISEDPTAPAAIRSASIASSAIFALVTASSWILSVSIASRAITLLSSVAPAIFWLVI